MKENNLTNKGFTLIELLAVIVILALIALIATPIVLNIISDSKQKAKNDSVNGIIDAVRLYYAQNHEMELPATIAFDSGGVASIGGTVIDLGLSGEKPTGGNIHVDSLGNIVASGLTFSDGYICNMALGENGCIKAEITGGNVITNPAIAYITSKDDNDLLIADPSDATRKIFKGATPNNYINLKENNVNVPYRIVSIESDGTIKVIREEKLSENKSWDLTDKMGQESITGGPRLNANNTYCMRWDGSNYVTANETGTYYGCNAWAAVSGTFTNGGYTGTVTQDAELNTYLNGDFYKTLDKSVQNLVVTHDFDNGGIKFNATTSDIKSQSMAGNWHGKIGIINGNDWFSATTNAECAPQTNGFYRDGGAYAETYMCAHENYLYKSGYWWWTLSPSASSRSTAFRVYSTGYFSSTYPCYSGGVRPAFYLTSNINLTGEGTSGSPFEIS